ncbi:hypothetical protein KP509_03G059100 [Ceratopteris richardii]|uniref:Uncharacterized protein n=1 Tax=Ceratopteris richardii TaxID=49495 RepID=A0A8T2V3T6_CERRI|nr:hypothetical protein KP509_03G059100 [Ceratopteris richardii]
MSTCPWASRRRHKLFILYHFKTVGELRKLLKRRKVFRANISDARKTVPLISELPDMAPRPSYVIPVLREAYDRTNSVHCTCFEWLESSYKLGYGVITIHIES